MNDQITLKSKEMNNSGSQMYFDEFNFIEFIASTWAYRKMILSITGIFSLSAIIYAYGVLLYSPEGQELVNAAAQDGDSTEFWALIIIVSVAITTAVLVVIWLFYKLLYGILLKKLRKNYNELKRLEV